MAQTTARSDDVRGATGQEATFVLVHGAWHGGWCWKFVAARLRSAGHEVFTPTLTGLGERAHLLRPGITLADHVDDVVNVLECEELNDVVLCGHSYGGMVITGVVGRVPDRVRAAVFVDAIVAEDGQSLADISPLRYAGDPIPPPEATAYVTNRERVPWVARRMTPQPRGTFESPAVGGGALATLTRRTYVLAGGFENPVTPVYAARAAADPAWSVETLAGSHDLMIDRPDELAQVLIDAARAADPQGS